ncbi:MAG: methyltransferase domain-containing protein [Caldithrix sp.]|nr:methyltransferase domain-containing protein [Caldithrix sp.]
MLSELKKQFPQSLKYDWQWAAKHEMGPNALWLTEFLTQAIALNQDMKVLDLGCGKAISSIFMAKEFNVQVWAADLWITPTDNWKRVQAEALEDRVFPVYAEAHSLPFAEGFFDVIISVDAYHYFGTDDAYLPYILKFLKPGGTLGIVAAGIRDEFNGDIPSSLKALWQPEMHTLHSPQWWRQHFAKTGLLNVTTCDCLPNGWAIWKFWEEYLTENGFMNPGRGNDLDLLNADGGRYLCFPRIIGQKQ